MRAKDYLIVTILLVAGGYCFWNGLSPAASVDTQTQPVTQASHKQSSGVVARAIEDVGVGMRIVGQNPIQEQVETWTPDKESWNELHLHMRKESGTSLWVTLIRPSWWVESKGAHTGGNIDLKLPEMGALGTAEVTYLGPCPEISPGKINPVVTGTFKHEVDENSNVISLRLEGQKESTGVTDNHPYWSVDRHKFVRAGELHIGENVNTISGTTRIVSKETLAYTGFLYNLETTEHVYRVGSLGTLVHNECALERFGSPLEAERSLAKGGLDLDPRFNGKVKNIAEPGAIDPRKLGRKNSEQFSHRISIQL